VVFVHPSLQPWYEKQGVREEDFDRGDFMAGGSGSRNWDERTRASADSAIGRSYDRFVDKVAASRRMPRERALEVAQGRVWLGGEARTIGLVDEVGGLDDAIRYARRVAGLDPAARFEPREFRRPRPGLLQRLSGSWLREALSREAQLHDPSGVRFESDDDFAF
jgi:ClpP class serine protease